MKQTIKQTIELTSNSLQELFELAFELRDRGWSQDEANPADTMFTSFKIGMVREATQEQIDADQAELNKPTRAEILAKARAAKAEKRQEGK